MSIEIRDEFNNQNEIKPMVTKTINYVLETRDRRLMIDNWSFF